jgi:hypothetical protein
VELVGLTAVGQKRYWPSTSTGRSQTGRPSGPEGLADDEFIAEGSDRALLWAGWRPSLPPDHTRPRGAPAAPSGNVPRGFEDDRRTGARGTAMSAERPKPACHGAVARRPAGRAAGAGGGRARAGKVPVLVECAWAAMRRAFCGAGAQHQPGMAWGSRGARWSSDPTSPPRPRSATWALSGPAWMLVRVWQRARGRSRAGLFARPWVARGR